MPDLEQTLEALQRANRVRLQRAGVKRALKAGKISLADALAHEATQTMTVWDLLCYLPVYGPAHTITRAEVTARKLVARCQATEFTLVKDLNARRTPLLLAAVEDLFMARSRTRPLVTAA